MSHKEEKRETTKRKHYERELRRVMAACGSKSPRLPKMHFLPGQNPCAEFRYGTKPTKHVLVAFREDHALLLTLSYIHPSDGRYKSLCSEPSPLHSSRLLAPEMARVLYKLGHTIEWIEENFDCISAHEQLELRLSMPRDLWPKIWIEEAQTSSASLLGAQHVI